MDPLVNYAQRAIEKPPFGREAAYAFADWKPAYVMASGRPIEAWEPTHIARVILPEPLVYLDGASVTKIAVHTKAAADLLHALQDIHRAGLWAFLSPYGGGYEFRAERGSLKLSMHALGLGLDFDPDANPYKSDPEKSRFGSSGEGRAVVRMFELYGWYWGGRFTVNPDPQHFQFARGV